VKRCRPQSNFARKSLTILSAAILTISLGNSMASAGSATTRATTSPTGSVAIAMANQDAIARLYQSIRSEVISSDIDTGILIDALDAEPNVLALLAGARQVGAPRAIADDVMQVRLEINGVKLRQVLATIAATKPERSPIPPQRLQLLMSEWDQKTFTAVGSSLGEFAIDPSMQSPTTRPTDDPSSFPQQGSRFRENPIVQINALNAMAGFTPADHQVELENAARHDAAERFVQRLEHDPALSKAGLDQLFQVPEKRLAFVDEIARSKAEVIDASTYTSRVELHLDSKAIVLQVEKLIGANAPVELADAVAIHAPVAVGFASVPQEDSPRSGFITPAWAVDPVNVEATNSGVGTPLQTARAAERSARTALAEKILTLAVDEKHTIRDVVIEDEVIRLRLESLVQDAQLAGIDYEVGGAVRVRISVDGSRVWAALIAD